MLIKLDPYKFLFLTIIFFSFFVYVLKSATIAYLFIFIGVMWVWGNEILDVKKNKSQHLIWLPYVFIASISLIINPYDGNYFSSCFLNIYILPAIFISLKRILDGNNCISGNYFVVKTIIYFLSMQLIVCIGQISSYLFGFGFPVSEVYSSYSMITGSFNNSNDLAASVLAMMFFVIGFEKNFKIRHEKLIWVIVFLLLIFSSSRSAILLSLTYFIFYKREFLRRYILFVLLFFALFLIFYNGESGVLNRMMSRISTIGSLVNGFNDGGSLSMRWISYEYFFKNILNLGFGSFEFGNYFKYLNGDDFVGSELMFRNPHSLIVEMGYWLGYVGLICFFVPFLMLLKYSKRRCGVITGYILISAIPSSVLGSITLLSCLMLIFFDFYKKDECKGIG